MIKALVLDVGDTLIRFDERLFYESLATAFRTVSASVYGVVDQPYNGTGRTLWQLHISGQLTTDELHRILVERFGVPVSRAQFDPIWASGNIGKTDAYDLIDGARRRHRLRAVFCTNVDEPNAIVQRRPGGLLDGLFDAEVQSWRLGVSKPEAPMYREALRLAHELAGAKPSECLFIDDVLMNVSAAREHGMAAVHYSHGNLPFFRRALVDHGLASPP